MDFSAPLWKFCCIIFLSLVVGCIAQSDGDLRLVGGTTSLEGRIEVFYENQWGTICNEGWDATDSQVVCKQLGFQVSLGSPSFGQGPNTQRIWLSNVQCEASDQRIVDCIIPDQWGQTLACAHDHDVGVRCSGINVGVAPNYRGCYRFADNPLSKRITSFASNTIETCLESCSFGSFSYAGLYGTFCICDDQIASGAQPVDNTMCRTRCPGDSTQLCGYDATNMELLSIYSVSIGDGYLSSPWFPGNYVIPGTDTSQPANLVSSANATPDSGNLLVEVLALDLAPTDTLTVVIGGNDLTLNPTQTEYLVSGLPPMTTLTATFVRGANSQGASGYLIRYRAPPVTTTPQPTTTTRPTTTQVTTPATTTPQTSLGPTTGATAAVTQETTTPTASNTSPAVTTTSTVTCTHPVVENGIIVEASQGSYMVGETVTLDCDEGREPEENTTLTCEEDGTWSPTPACASTSFTFPVWLVVVISLVIAICLIVLIVCFLICAVAFGKRDHRREDEQAQPITHIATPVANDYGGRPPLIPITEASASGLVRQGTNISTASTVGDPSPARSNDAVQQTEPAVVPPPPPAPPPEPPSPTESYPPRDYPGANNRDSVISNGTAQRESNSHVSNLGIEERQAVDQLINAVRDYDDPPSPAAGLYGAVAPRHLRSGSAISVISNPGRVTDGRISPRYNGNGRAVQFDPPNFRG